MNRKNKRNGGFSVSCDLKVLHVFVSSDETSSEKNDTMQDYLIGWADLVYGHFFNHSHFRISFDFRGLI